MGKEGEVFQCTVIGPQKLLGWLNLYSVVGTCTRHRRRVGIYMVEDMDEYTDGGDIDERAKRLAEEMVGGTGSGLPKRDLRPKEIEKLAVMCVAFGQEMTGIKLHPYQEEFAWRIAYSVLMEDAEEITALFARQSGKTETVAVMVVGLMALMPVLAREIYWDERIAKFKDGLWCGIYAPTLELASIMWSRMKARLYSQSSKRVLLDPDIDIDLTGHVVENMTLPNGSFVDCGTASPQSKIEGKTYHLILLEETQDILSRKIRASIHPMAAAVAGTLVKIGTCNKVRSDFYDACRRNKRSDVNRGLVRSRKRNHFEFDYTVVQRYNPRYRKYVTKERARLGEDSDDFRMKYRLHWLLGRGMFVDPDLFSERGIRTNRDELVMVKGKGRRSQKFIFTRAPNVVAHDQKTDDLIASVDVGKEASTVVTIYKVFWDGGVKYGNDVRYPMHVLNWKELQGDDHEAQHPQIIDFLKNYNISQVVVDATGKGDPVYSRLAADLEGYGIVVVPFIFSAKSKDIGYKIFAQEISTARFSYPAGGQATKLQKWKKFVTQMEDLEKSWRGPLMVVNKPSGDDEARDDYCDSAMMGCWLVNGKGTMEVEEQDNPFLGRQARWNSVDMLKQTGAWFRKKFEPNRHQGTRPGKRGKWD